MIILIEYFLKENTNEKFDSQKRKNWTELKNDYQLRWNMMNNLQTNMNLMVKQKLKSLNYYDIETVEYLYGYCLDSPGYEKCEK